MPYICQSYQNILSGLSHRPDAITSDSCEDFQKLTYQDFRSFRDPSTQCDLKQLIALKVSNIELESDTPQEALKELYSAISDLLSMHVKHGSLDPERTHGFCRRVVEFLAAYYTNFVDGPSMRPKTPVQEYDTSRAE